MGSIRCFDKESAEYKRLEVLGKMLTEASPHGTEYRVENVYFDFGQDWMWTTLVAYRLRADLRTGELKYSSWQALYPAVHELCVELGDDPAMMEKAFRAVMDSKWNPDR